MESTLDPKKIMNGEDKENVITEMSYNKRLWRFTDKNPATESRKAIREETYMSIIPIKNEKTKSGIRPNAGFFNIFCKKLFSIAPKNDVKRAKNT